MASIKAKRLVGDLYQTDHDYPAKGFMLEYCKKKSDDNDLNRVSNNVFKVVTYLADHDVAHNVFMTKGRSLSSSSLSSDDDDTIRILIWPRETITGHKDPGDFCIAVCELAGQILIYNQQAYNNMDENKIIEAHKKTCQSVFEIVTPNIIQLFDSGE